MALPASDLPPDAIRFKEPENAAKLNPALLFCIPTGFLILGFMAGKILLLGSSVVGETPTFMPSGILSHKHSDWFLPCLPSSLTSYCMPSAYPQKPWSIYTIPIGSRLYIRFIPCQRRGLFGYQHRLPWCLARCRCLCGCLCRTAYLRETCCFRLSASAYFAEAGI